MSDPLKAVVKRREDKPTDDPKVTRWLNLITASKKREKKWREKGQQLVEMYQAETATQNAFNILYANTETMGPAVLSSIPRPRVRKRWGDMGEVAGLGAQAVERMLTFTTDPGSAATSPFGHNLKEAVRAALVPGRGVTVFQYEPTFVDAQLNPETQQLEPKDAIGSAKEAKSGSNEDNDDDAGLENSITPSNQAVVKEAADEPKKLLVQENICGYPVEFDAIVLGYAKSWSDLPWLALEYNMTEDDAESNFGKQIADNCEFCDPPSSADTKSDLADAKAGQPKTMTVYAIWVKDTKKVMYVSEGYRDGFLKVADDPLELSGFWPVPEQLCFFLISASTQPVPLYSFYEQQAKELNQVTIRINKLISVMKARGIYDKSMVDADGLKNAEDGQMMATANTAAMMQGSLDRAIWMWPVEKLIGVLQQLYMQRSQVKQIIYEITGLSDILRGSSVASETATAQNIKNQWGTLRLRESQNLVGLYARNCFRIIAEIAINKFEVETWKRMTQMDLMTAQEQQEGKAQLEQMKQQYEQAQQQQQAPMQPPQPGQPSPDASAATAPPQPGMPPQGQPQDAPATPAQPSGPSPEQIKQFTDLQAKVAKPTWDDVLTELRKNVKDGYLIDIETNSTLDADATEDKKDIADLVGALAQCFQTLGPAVESGALPVGAAKALLLMATENYRFGDTITDAIKAIPDQMPPKKDEGADGAAEKAKAEIEVLQQKAQIEQQSGQMDLQLKQAQLEFEKEKLAFEKQKMQQEQQLSMQDMQFKQMEREATHQGKMQSIQAKTQQAMAQAAMPPAQPQQGPM